MRPFFVDRRDAGAQLAVRLDLYRDRPNLFVLGLPRGGIPVAAEVARALGGVLDLFVVRKLGVPGHEELAMGAIASGGVRVLNEAVIREFGITAETIEKVVGIETRELDRREREYRGDRRFPELSGATVILIDDGVATGASMLAAVAALRRLHPAWLVVAAPVMSGSASAALSRAADECVYLAQPEPFFGVGRWYEDFAQTADDEVRALLAAAPAERRSVGRPYASRS